MELLYRLSLQTYASGIRLASFFNPKAKKWIEGRSNWRDFLKAKTQALSGSKVWVHCASVGEYEQAIPVLEKLREKKQISVVLTFFSPSGYEHHKNTHLADLVAYLPIDNSRNAKDFLDIVNPDQAVFVKYEFWYYYLKALNERAISTFLVSAVFREDQHFFKSYGVWFRKSLAWYDTIFVQNRKSLDLLKEIGIINCTVSGDTRLDRVLDLVNTNEQFPLLQEFKKNDKVLIVGSSWETEDEWIIRLIKEEKLPGWKFIIAPHEIDEAKLRRIENELPVVRYSNLSNDYEGDIVLCDGYGYLSRIYRYADVGLIGGGFNSGIHSILEPAAFGVPLFFGPDNKSFVEASALKEVGVGIEVSTYEDFRDAFLALSRDDEKINDLSVKAKNYVKINSGASEVIAESLAINLNQ
jgi:3-deoxy-D-manno-octulosonic-acid transferase